MRSSAGFDSLTSRAASAISAAKSLGSQAWNTIKSVAGKTKRAVLGFVSFVRNPLVWGTAVFLIAALLFTSLFQTLGKDDVKTSCDTADSASTVNLGGDIGNNEDAKKIVAILNDPKSVGADSLAGKFGKTQIAALLGNWTIESSMHFNVTYGHQKDGASNSDLASWLSGKSVAPIGLVQWNGGRASALVKLADSEGKQWYDGSVQMKMFLNEMQAEYGKTLEGHGFFSTDDLQTATRIVQDYYEVPALPGTPAAAAELSKRYAAAQTVAKAIGGMSTTTVEASCDDAGAHGDPRFGSTDNPGIKDDEWSKASKYAQATVNTAIAFVQDDRLFYQQLPPNAGGYDCSAFVTAVIELATGYTYAGTKVTKGYDPKDFFEHRAEKTKRDLQWPTYTGGMMAAVPASSKAYVGMSSDGDIEGKLQPGDVFVNDEHTKMYAGHRASDGKVVWVQSSCPGAEKWKDIAMTKKRSDMGVSVSSGIDAGDGMTYQVYRPYVLMGSNG